MIQTLLFLFFTGIVTLALVTTSHVKKVNFRSMVSLFLFGMMLSIPFIMVEYMGGHLKYYLVILAFITIELGVLILEKKIKFLHDLIQHNVKELRITSFILIGLGFTYSEISFTLLHAVHTFSELMTILPFKILYSLLAHTVLASTASLVSVGSLFAETIYETVFKLASYYGRVVIVSISHYLYIFSMERNFILLIAALLITAVVTFFYVKKHLDLKHLELKREEIRT